MANHLPFDKKTLVVSMLAEDSSIRAIERITDVNRNTIMNLGVRVGQACAKIMDQKMRGLDCRNIELDEIGGFIGKKRANATADEIGDGLGDVWTWIALDMDTKLIPSFHVGRRDSFDAWVFIDDLAPRLKGPRATVVRCAGGLS